MLRNSSAVLPGLRQTSTVNPEFIGCNLINGGWTAKDRSVIYDGNA
jgi:hypothetical protein